MRYLPEWNIADLLSPERVSLDFSARSKGEALVQLADLVLRGVPGVSAERVLEVLAAREALGSTGIGSGVAIPHGRIEGVQTHRVGLAVASQGVDFEAIDNAPVRLFVVVAAPTDAASRHLQVLAALSKVLRSASLRAALLGARSAEEACEIVQEGFAVA